MALPFQPYLRRGPSTTRTTLLQLVSTLKAPAPPQQPAAAAITRALHNISRHTTRSSRSLQQQQHHHQCQQRWPLPRLRRRPYSSTSHQATPPKPASSPSQSTPPPPPNPKHPPTTSPSLSARLRTLSREYGWSAFGVYLALSALDFPFCFLAVRSLGADTIGHYEHLVVGYVSGFIPEGVKGMWREVGGWVGARVVEPLRKALGGGGSAETEASSLSEAVKNTNNDKASIATQLALAYAIHKSFIFVRVPLTVAVTPRVVKFLRGLGWDIGRRRPKEVREAVREARRAGKKGRGGK